MVNSRLCETVRPPVSKFETETLRLRDLSQTLPRDQKPARPTFFEEPFYTLKSPQEWLLSSVIETIFVEIIYENLKISKLAPYIPTTKRSE